jgi:hypothetical protein
MPKWISGKIKRKILIDMVKKDKMMKDVAKTYNISTATLYNLRKENREMYQKIVEDVKNTVRDRALLTADKSIKYIKNDKLKASSAKDLSIISKTLYDISTENQGNQINIQVNIPNDRNQLIDMIMDTGKVIKTVTPINKDEKVIE